jgi:hypothetical protein
MFSRLPTLKSFALAASIFVSLVFVGGGVCSCSSTRHAETNLKTALHTRPGKNYRMFDADQITNALVEFDGNREVAFTVLKEASNETNMLVDAGRIIDTNNFVRAGAIYGIGQLGKSVPEAAPFLWKIIYAQDRRSIDRWMAFQSLQTIGFEARDIPALAKLLSSPASNQNILTRLVPETISELIETNPPAAKPFLPAVEILLDDPNPDIQFRAALALIKSEGAGNTKIFAALHALFQRPNDRASKYYKNIAAQILGEAGPRARPLVPDLLEFAKLPDEADTYQLVAKIAPELGSQIPTVAQALKEQQHEQMWADKWETGSYTLDDLRSALKEPDQTLIAAKHLAEMGAAAKSAVPDMIQAMWGKWEPMRDEILTDIHKIDPQLKIIKIDVNNPPVIVALGSAHTALEKMSASPRNKALTDSCFQMFFTAGWVLPEELAALTNSLGIQAPEAYRAYVEGLKPPTCGKPVQKTPEVWGAH